MDLTGITAFQLRLIWSFGETKVVAILLVSILGRVYITQRKKRQNDRVLTLIPDPGTLGVTSKVADLAHQPSPKLVMI